MKITAIPSFVLLAFMPLLFSCGQRSDVDTQASNDTAAVKDHPGIIEKITHATLWTIDARSSKVKFEIKNMGMTVDGTLGGLSGSIFFNENNLAGSSFETSVDVSTINTGISKRDADLMKEKFFDQGKYKHIVFRSDSIYKSGNRFIASGKLTMKGISQHKNIPFTFTENGSTGIFQGSFDLNRLDYNVGGDGPVMGTEVNVDLTVVTSKK